MKDTTIDFYNDLTLFCFGFAFSIAFYMIISIFIDTAKETNTGITIFWLFISLISIIGIIFSIGFILSHYKIVKRDV